MTDEKGRQTNPRTRLGYAPLNICKTHAALQAGTFRSGIWDKPYAGCNSWGEGKDLLTPSHHVMTPSHQWTVLDEGWLLGCRNLLSWVAFGKEKGQLELRKLLLRHYWKGTIEVFLCKSLLVLAWESLAWAGLAALTSPVSSGWNVNFDPSCHCL